MCSFITRVTRDVHETWKNCSWWRCIGYYRPFCPRLGQVVNINLAWYVIMCVTLLIVVFNSAAVGGGGGGDGWGSGFLCFSMFSIVSHGDVLAGSDPFSSETRQACRCVWKNHVFLNPPPRSKSECVETVEASHKLTKKMTFDEILHLTSSHSWCFIFVLVKLRNRRYFKYCWNLKHRGSWTPKACKMMEFQGKYSISDLHHWEVSWWFW